MHLVIYLVSLPFQCCPTLANRIYALLSHITALRFPLVQQLSPQADHLPWRLIMCSIIIINAPKLTKLQAMHVLHRPGAVELFYPHSHAHVLHLKQLQWVYVRIIFMFSFPDRTGKRERERLGIFHKADQGYLPSAYVSQTRKLCTLQCQMR